MYYSISHFRERISALLKVKRGVYAGVVQEIHDAFDGASIETIRNNRDMILMDEEHVFVKLRIPDHKRKLSKRDGFRLIYLVYKYEDIVVLLDIYPKQGPLQQISINDNDLADLIELYVEERKSAILEQYVI